MFIEAWNAMCLNLCILVTHKGVLGECVKTQMKATKRGIAPGSALFARIKHSSGTETHCNWKK